MGTSFLDLFEPRKRLGQGGMGEVWEVRHRLSGDALAVKFAAVPEGASNRDRFVLEREVRAQARVYHPHVVPILAFGELEEAIAHDALVQSAGARWCAFAVVRGGDLEGRTVEGPMLRRVLLRVLDALAHCHARDLLHLDLKPGNLLWDEAEERVYLADFGVAQLMGRQDRRIGSPAYLAPEQWRGTALDARTDLYQLGCTAYHLAVGLPPYLGRVERVQQAHLERPMPSSDDPALDAWLARMCAKQPADRFPSAAAAARALPMELGAAPYIPGLPSRVPSKTLTLSAVFVGDEAPDAPDAAPPRTGALPLPPDWRTPRIRLHDVGVLGLGSVGVRDVPVLGREATQDALWAAATRVHRGDGAELVVVQGPPGAGRTRVLHWLGARLREVDAAVRIDGRPHGPEQPLGLQLADDADAARLQSLAERTFAHRESGARVLTVASVLPDVPVPDGALVLPIGPLAGDAALALATAWLALDPITAAELVRRAGALPGAMAWLLETRIRRGDVRSSRDGVHLVGTWPQVDAPLTDDERRFVAVVHALTVPGSAQVHRLAAACGLDSTLDLRRGLVRRGLLVEDGDELRLGARTQRIEDPDVRRTLLAQADHPYEKAVQAVHLGLDVEAVHTTLADDRMPMATRYVQALLAVLPGYLDGLDLPPDDVRRAQHQLLIAYHARYTGDPDLAGEAVAALRVHQPAWERWLGRALWLYSEVLSTRHQLDRAQEVVLEAQALLARSGTPSERVLACMAEVKIALNRFDWDGASRAQEKGEALPDLGPTEHARLSPWRRSVLASRGQTREALEMTLAGIEAAPTYFAMYSTLPLLYFEHGEPEAGIRTIEQCTEAPEVIQEVVKTLAALCRCALGDWEGADRDTLEPAPSFVESTRRHIRLVLAAPELQRPFDLLLAGLHTEAPSYEDTFEVWLLRTAALRARQAGLLARAERAEALADLRAGRLPDELQRRIRPAGPFPSRARQGG